jgi:hypothetical protein
MDVQKGHDTLGIGIIQLLHSMDVITMARAPKNHFHLLTKVNKLYRETNLNQDVL